MPVTLWRKIATKSLKLLWASYRIEGLKSLGNRDPLTAEDREGRAELWIWCTENSLKSLPFHTGSRNFARIGKRYLLRIEWAPVAKKSVSKMFVTLQFKLRRSRTRNTCLQREMETLGSRRRARRWIWCTHRSAMSAHFFVHVGAFWAPLSHLSVILLCLFP